VNVVDVLSIALSGLKAQKQQVDAAANNIANANTTGSLPSAESPASSVYKPLTVNYTALAGGGVTTTVSEDPNGYIPVYGPKDPYANSDGLVAAPKVDLTQEMVSILQAKTLFKANLEVIETHSKMMGSLMDEIG
jgi:flagellar basal-body rod protein FlgC